MNKQCKNCHKTFKITDSDQQFYNRINVPPPTQCPPCRMQRRLAFRNERMLFQNKCELCKKNIISIFNPKDKFIVYCPDCYWSDKWDGLKTGMDFDFNKPFFEQFEALIKRSPRLSVGNRNSENSDYTNAAADNKNCYLLFAAENNENCCFGKLVQNCKDCYDCNFIYDSELCYSSVDLKNCYHVYYSKDLQDCNECYFSIDCKGCSNCLFCSNLVNENNYIFNKPVSESEFKKRAKEITSSYKKIQAALDEFQKIKDKHFVNFSRQIKSENCTGDYLTSCRRVYDSYDITNGQDCRYLNDALDPKDTHDSAFIYYNPELCYETMSTLALNNVQYSLFCYHGSNLQYCDQLDSCNDCFACTSLKKANYCIFNKQYSNQDYQDLRIKVIKHMKRTGEWGQMFPMSMSCFAYNDTVAQEYFPLKPEDAKNLNLKWNHEENNKTANGLNASELPDSIDEVQDDILEKIIICEKSNRPFKITKQELAYYRNQKLPLPHYHPETRHGLRMQQRNPRQIWQRTCQKPGCNNQFETTYSPERKELVYCEKCYKEEIY